MNTAKRATRLERIHKICKNAEELRTKVKELEEENQKLEDRLLKVAFYLRKFRCIDAFVCRVDARSPAIMVASAVCEPSVACGASDDAKYRATGSPAADR